MAFCIVGFFDLLRDGFAEPGTTARLNGELGAKPPNPVKVSSQIGPGSRYQRCQPGEKVLGSEQNMSGAIAERVLEFVAHLAGCVGRQPLQTDGGPRDVTTQAFEAISLVWLAGNTFSEKPFLSTVKGFGW